MPFFHCASVDAAFSSGPASDQASVADFLPTTAGMNFFSRLSIAIRSAGFRRTLVLVTSWAGPSSFVGLPLPGVEFGIAATAPATTAATTSGRAIQNTRRRMRGDRGTSCTNTKVPQQKQKHYTSVHASGSRRQISGPGATARAAALRQHTRHGERDRGADRARDPEAGARRREGPRARHGAGRGRPAAGARGAGGATGPAPRQQRHRRGARAARTAGAGRPRRAADAADRRGRAPAA